MLYTPLHAKTNRSHFFQAFLGTQPDKLEEAISSLHGIIEDMPYDEGMIENARQSVIQRIQTQRISGSRIYWNRRANVRRGYNRDLRKDLYDFAQKMSPADLIPFHRDFIKGRKYAYLILGDRERMDFDLLQKLGPVTELTSGGYFRVQTDLLN